MAGGRDIRAGKSYVELYVKNAALLRGLANAERRLRSFGTAATMVGTRMMAAGAAVTAPLLGAVKQFANVGDSLNKMSLRTGVSVESLSQLGFAAEQSGGGLEVLEKGIIGMQKSILNAERGLSTSVDTFDDLGLSVASLQGLSPEQQFKTIADAISRVEDPSRRAGLALQILGKSGQKLLPMMMDGAKGIEALQIQADSMGLTISTADAQKAADFTDQMNILWRVLKVGVFSAGSAVVDVLGDFVKRAIESAGVVMKWIKSNHALIGTVFKVAVGVTAAGAAFVTIGTGALLLASTLGIVSTGFTTVAAAMGFLLSPVGLVTAAVAGLGAWLLTSTKAGGDAVDWLGGRFRGLLDVVGDTFGAIVNAIKAGDIQAAMEVVTSSLKLTWLELKTWLVDLWNGFKDFWFGLTTGLVSAMLNAMESIKTAWAGLIGWLTKKWEEWKTSSTTEEIADVMLETYEKGVGGKAVGGLIKPFDDEGLSDARQALKEDFARGRKALPGRLSDIDAETEAKQGAIASDAAAVQRELAADNARSVRAGGRAIGDAAKELAAARKARDAAIVAAKEARNIGVAGGKGKPFPDMPTPDIPDITAAMSSNIKGTFKGSELSGLGAKTPAERTAKAVEKMLTATERLLAIDENLLREQKRLTLEATA